MSDFGKQANPRAKPPVRDSGPVERVRGNREVPPARKAHSIEESEEQVEAAVEDELARAHQERDEYLESLQRLKAEFDNFRKRAAREQASIVTRANEQLVRELLPVVDDLERALEAASKHEEAAKPPVRESGSVEGVRGNREVSPGMEEVLEGVRLVQRALADALTRAGLAEIETNGRFDPNIHEALLAQPSDQEEGSVIDVVQKGYRLGDRVLRPARVVVAGSQHEGAEPPVRESGPGEGARGNREVPPGTEA